MKYCRRLLTVLFMMALLVFLPAAKIEAAALPANVKTLKAKTASETSITLTWSKAARAKGYLIYQVDETTGKLKGIKETKNTKYTITKLPVNKKYTYVVYGYYKKSGKQYTSAKASPKASAWTYVTQPATPANFRVQSYGDQSAVLKWNSVKYATGYRLYYYNLTKKEYVKLTDLNTNSYTVKGLQAGQKYYYKVQAYRTLQGQTRESTISNELTVTGKKFSAALKAVHGRYHSATVKSKTTATIYGTTKTIVIPAKTKLSTTSKSNATVTAVLKNGTVIRILGKKLNYGNLSISTKEYSKAVKEEFVNAKGYSSSTNYLIWISQYTANVSVFQGSQGNWTLIRSMPCVIGRYGKTPVGVKKICRLGTQYGGPIMYFTWNAKKFIGNAFHLYVDSNTRGAYSSGCVRLSRDNLYYIYNRCKIGTTVVSY